MTNNYLQSLQLTELAYGTEKTKARLNAKHTHTRIPVNERRCPSIQQTGSTWHLTQWNIDAQTQGTWTYLQRLSDESHTCKAVPLSPNTQNTHKKKCSARTKPLTGSWSPRLLWMLFSALLGSGFRWDHCRWNGGNRKRQWWCYIKCKHNLYSPNCREGNFRCTEVICRIKLILGLLSNSYSATSVLPA